MTARPPRVFMRVRKPWVRARLTLEGWYVRFMVYPTACLKNPGLTVGLLSDEKMMMTPIQTRYTHHT
jgi:hypothetical protein